ncbi:MAG: SufD family Fe-S cluster assembly protein [Acidimicrobiales bacterium]
MSSTIADAVSRQDGPGWLQERRSAAYDRFGSRPLPSTEEEVWRYSRIDELEPERYSLVGHPQDRPAVPELDALIAAAGPAAALVIVRNGRVAHIEIADDAASAGLTVGRLLDVDPEGSSLGDVAGPPPDAIGELHDALATEPVLIAVKAGKAIAAPVVVMHWTDADVSITAPHLVVRLGENSEVTVYDHQASADVDALVLPVVELDVGAAARLRYQNAQTLGPRVWQLGRQASRVGRDAHLLTAMVALGGDYARLSVDSTMVGKGGSGDMLAVYFGEGGQLLDFRTTQDHVAPATTSNLLFKGAVQDRSRAVYTGLIHIGKDAAGVNAFQTNRNVKLSSGAWAESVPNLEIENNDVHCSHASAVGPVDEDQRFYLESRGVPPEAAERLVVLGFFEEVLERLPVPGAAAPLRAEIAAKLARRRPDDEVGR